MRALKRQLQLWHRWFGIALVLPIVSWFVSGAILLFVPYPRLLDSERLAGLPPLALEQVRIGPVEAARAAGIAGVPMRARLGMSGSAAAWRLRDAADNAFVIDAARATPIAAVDGAQAMAVARDFQQRSTGAASLPVRRDTIERDQWTINGLRGLQPPLHRLHFGDGRVLYVSRDSGEVVRDASRVERNWGWPGAVLHWIYITPLRANAPLWNQLVLWLSGLSLVVAISGFGIGLWRTLDAWRRDRRISGYRGIHRWHHLLGWAGGGLVLTWLFSGFMSMSPLEYAGNDAAMAWHQAWTQPPQAWPDGNAALPTRGAASAADLVEVELVWVAGEPWYRALHRNGAIGWQSLLPTTDRAPDLERAIARANVASGQSLRQRALLTAEAVDYVGHPHRDARELPVWRFELEDPGVPWLYVSPRRMDIVAISDRTGRIDRWLYNGLHSWDVPWLLQRPILRQGLMLAGLALGLALSITGFVVGWRRLRAIAA